MICIPRCTSRFWVYYLIRTQANASFGFREEKYLDLLWPPQTCTAFCGCGFFSDHLFYPTVTTSSSAVSHLSDPCATSIISCIICSNLAKAIHYRQNTFQRVLSPLAEPGKMDLAIALTTAERLQMLSLTCTSSMVRY